MNGTKKQPTRAQNCDVVASALRYMKTNDACHAALAMAVLAKATLVREYRVATTMIAKRVSAAAVTAGGTAYADNWNVDMDG